MSNLLTKTGTAVLTGALAAGCAGEAPPEQKGVIGLTGEQGATVMTQYGQIQLGPRLRVMVDCLGNVVGSETTPSPNASASPDGGSKQVLGGFALTGEYKGVRFNGLSGDEFEPEPGGKFTVDQLDPC